MIFYIAYSLIGKLFIYLFQISPYPKLIIRLFKGKEGGFLDKLFSCDLCLGFWIYFFLALVFQYANVDVNIIKIVPVFDQIVTGAFTTFVIHLVSIGWKDKFGTFVIGG